MATNDHCLNCDIQGTVVCATNGKFCTTKCQEAYKPKPRLVLMIGMNADIALIMAAERQKNRLL